LGARLLLRTRLIREETYLLRHDRQRGLSSAWALQMLWEIVGPARCPSFRNIRRSPQ
jgi:hypothetical protein